MSKVPCGLEAFNGFVWRFRAQLRRPLLSRAKLGSSVDASLELVPSPNVLSLKAWRG